VAVWFASNFKVLKKHVVKKIKLG